MAEERIDALVDIYWKEWDKALAGLGAGEHDRLIAAIGAVDTVWDRHLFEHAETFGGAEIGYARALSAAILGRLLGVDYAALASVAGNEIPLTGDETLDKSLATARQEALDTFSADLLGPVKVGNYFVFAKPMLLESPVPIGAVVLATRGKVTAQQERLLEGFLRHLDTRLDAAEHILKLRWRNLDLEFELKKLKGEVKAPEPVGRVKREAIPEDVEQSMADLAQAVPKLHDAKDESKLAAPYLRLLEIMGSLRRAARLLYQVTADELAPYGVGGRAPTFADVTRVAKNLTEDETTQHILEIMNDQGEEAELDALSARSHPYEFRAANTGEVSFCPMTSSRTCPSEARTEPSRRMRRSSCSTARTRRPSAFYSPRSASSEISGMDPSTWSVRSLASNDIVFRIAEDSRRTLTRISHQLSAAGADAPHPAVFSRLGVLDVP
jgi:hypothetical protein